MKKALIAVAMAVVVAGTANVAHSAYQYRTPSITSISTAAPCTSFYLSQVKVSFKRTAPYTTVQFKRSTSRTWGSRYPFEFGSAAETKNDTSAVMQYLRPSTRYDFRVYSSDHAGFRKSGYSKVKSFTTGPCT